jgi:hypothetical protein
MHRNPIFPRNKIALALPPRWRRLDIQLTWPGPAAVGWVAGVLVLAALAFAAIFILLLVMARQVHTGIDPDLARRLFLLDHAPSLVFAGDSRARYQVDPLLVADLLGKRRGFAVNIAAVGGDATSLANAIDLTPERFRDADLVVSVSTFHVNDGALKDFYFATSLINRLTTPEQLRLFLPRYGGSLVRYIREAFESRLLMIRPAALDSAVEQRLGYAVPPPPGRTRRIGSVIHDGPYDRGWNPRGIKAHYVKEALCKIRRSVRRLVVYVAPFTPVFETVNDKIWNARMNEYYGLLERLGAECGFDVLIMRSVPGLTAKHFRDPTHITAEAVPIFTRHLIERLGYLVPRS